jgi:sensor c-di-GMP phosphodiesterase-like protein
MSTNTNQLELINHLRSRGIKIAIDDFCTGYSAIDYLRRLPVNYIKIDKSFVSPIGSNSSAIAIITSLISLSHALNMKVIAEGIETQQQHQVLKQLGGDYQQGCFFSKPLPLNELIDYLKTVQGIDDKKNPRQASGV